MNLLDKAALGAIRCYKTRISHLKGYRCAYGVTHGITCSTVGENLVKEHGIMKARPLIRQQFKDCQAEYEKLKAERESNPDTAPLRSNNDSCHGCDTNACSMPFWGFGSRKSAGNSNNCDVFDCDIGGCDL